MVSPQCEKRWSDDGTHFGGQRVFVFALLSQRRGGSRIVQMLQPFFKLQSDNKRLCSFLLSQRVTIRENVDLIRLQKQLSDKSTALLVMQEKCKALQESQKALKLSHNSLLEKVEELTEQLKEETQRNITLESQLETASISQRALEEFQERITDLENEKALLKQDYDKLLESTLELDTQRSWQEGEAALRKEVCRLEDALHTELSEKRQALEQREREREISESLQERHLSLEQEILQQREEMTSLQLKLDFITKVGISSPCWQTMCNYSNNTDYKHIFSLLKPELVSGQLEAARDWKMLADVGQRLIFPPEIATTNLRPDIVLWSGSARLVHLIELTVPWEDAVDEAYERKKLRYAQLATEAEQRGWRVRVYPVEVGCRGFVAHSTTRFLRDVGFSGQELRRTVKNLSEAAERSSNWLWMRRKDSGWGSQAQ
ncbi:UNVERIFIED_CONTAM: hypothetical protein FKN15_023230 [Acipenser sinensis]